jgi:hypothetical protein
MKGNTMPNENPQSNEQRILDSLTLGVKGHRVEDNRERAALAATIVEAFEVAEDAAYKKAGPFQEPHLIRPYAAQMVNQHGGDLLAVVGDPAFEDMIIQSLELNPSEEIFNGEDGVEFSYTIPLEDPANQELLSTVLANVRAGVTQERANQPTPLDRAKAALQFALGQQKHGIAHAAAGKGESVKKVHSNNLSKAPIPGQQLGR